MARSEHFKPTAGAVETPKSFVVIEPSRGSCAGLLQVVPSSENGCRSCQQSVPTYNVHFAAKWSRSHVAV